MTAPRVGRTAIALAVSLVGSAATLAALAGGAAWAAPLPEPGYGLPRDVSVDGHRIDHLLYFTLGAITVVFAVVAALLVWSLARHNREHPALYSHGNGRSIAVVVGAVAALLVGVDGYLFVHTLGDMRSTFWNFPRAEAAEGAVRIEVNAHQWSWDARYPGADGKFGTPDDVVTLDDVRVPVGVPVVVQLASTDVIHSMYLPNFRVKQDAVPGTVTRLTFRAKVPGEYEIACAQHCGANHYKMRGVLTVLAPQAFREWLAEAGEDARRAYDPEDAEAHWGWEWRTEP
ncbi:MAG TPA: cupredoxin domain-containing protein [Anaeromyxobacteraceae bacterium]|nr:cupredoxin domain-containing protein [Anaeromyxobacteraceae bacterium]